MGCRTHQQRRATWPRNARRLAKIRALLSSSSVISATCKKSLKPVGPAQGTLGVGMSHMNPLVQKHHTGSQHRPQTAFASKKLSSLFPHHWLRNGGSLDDAAPFSHRAQRPEKVQRRGQSFSRPAISFLKENTHGQERTKVQQVLPRPGKAQKERTKVHKSRQRHGQAFYLKTCTKADKERTRSSQSRSQGSQGLSPPSILSSERTSTETCLSKKRIDIHFQSDRHKERCELRASTSPSWHMPECTTFCWLASPSWKAL